jgi:hypothetical protein
MGGKGNGFRAGETFATRRSRPGGLAARDRPPGVGVTPAFFVVGFLRRGVLAETAAFRAARPSLVRVAPLAFPVLEALGVGLGWRPVELFDLRTTGAFGCDFISKTEIQVIAAPCTGADISAAPDIRAGRLVAQWKNLR